MSLQRKIDALFLVSLFIFAGLFYTALQNSKFTRESSRLVAQAHEILYNLEKVESAIAGIEGAHRGFIISGEGEYLDPVVDKKTEIDSAFQALSSLIGGSKEQMARLDELSQLIAKKMEIGSQGVGLRKMGDTEKALGLVSSGKGKRLMDRIRKVSQELESEEINALAENTSQNEALLGVQTRDFLLFSGFIFLVISGFYIRIRRNAEKLLTYRQKQDELIRELNYQNRQLDEFAHLTAHNIRSPAGNIYTLISLLNEKSSLDDYKMIYEKLTTVSKNLNETLNELIEVLHVKNNTDIEQEELSFQGVFNKVKESMQGDILVSHALISSDFEKAKNIQYPKTYLESIFHNLLSNAIKYSSPQRTPEIHVSTRTLKGKTVLQVTDNGLGIDLERYGHQIFGLRKTFHRNINAKGIGLFMTKTQIEALGGEISIKSEPNKGTTFTVVFSGKNTRAATLQKSEMTVS